MVLQTVFRPFPTYSVPAYFPATMPKLAKLSLYCPSSPENECDETSELENEIAEILPIFDSESVDKDWNSFGYLLNEAVATTATTSETSSESETPVFKKPIEPIGKGRRRRRINSSTKPKAEVKKEVINPADITLGGDTYDYVKEETPTEESKPTADSIASGVARRRRTSANLSKSEDGTDSQAVPTTPTTRGTKERRTSEPVRAAFYGIGTGLDIDMAVVHCICEQMYDAQKFYVQCDMCARWYHGECVDVTEKKAQMLDHWTCEQCIEEQDRVKDEPALYCMCKKPYDDTKFYVGCDSCQGWFHPECVGITREVAEAAAEYNCPSCIREADYDSEASDGSVNSRASSMHELTRSDYVHVIELLEMLLEHRMSTPFRNPVDLNVFPDYEQTIKKPMDLSMISHKVENVEYAYLREFANDVHLMFENAKSYNPKDNAVFKCAETMQEVFEKKLMEVKQQMMHQRIVLQQQQPSTSMANARKRVQSESQRTVDSLDIDSDQLLPLDPSLFNLINYNL